MNSSRTTGKSVSSSLARFIASVLIAFGCFIPALRAQAASITLGSTNVPSGATFAVPITTDSGAQPLGRYEAFISYDTNVLLVVSYVSATTNFSGPNVNTAIAGKINVACDSTSGSLDFPTGVLQVAQITFQAIGSPGTSSPLSFDSFVLYDAQTVSEISATANNGLVSILGQPTANFSGTPTNGLAPLGTIFTDTSTGTIANRFWDFGDGGTTNTTATSVPHTYNAAGMNTVTLIVSGPVGASTNTRPDYIVVNSPASDTTAPSMTILTPMNNEAFTNANIAVTGRAGDVSGIKDVTVNGAAAVLVGTNWSKGFTLSSGTNLITVIARDNSAAMNGTTQFVHAIFTPLNSGIDTTPPTVQITSPTNGFVTTERMIDATGNAQDDNVLDSVVVTNSRGGSTDAVIAGTNWTASGVTLKLGTNLLFAVATDGFTNAAQDVVTVVRVSSNYVNTTLRVTKGTLTLGGANNDSISLAGIYNDVEVTYNALDTGEVMFGDYEAMTSSNGVVNLKYKAKASLTNTLTALSFKSKKRTFSFSASGLTLTNLNSFMVATRLGSTDLGPDTIAFQGATLGGGKYGWAYGTQFPLVDQFFLGKSKLTTNSFSLTGTIYITNFPDPLTDVVDFGIGSYEEPLPTNGWAKGAGNEYTYARPQGQATGVEKMTIDFDKGTWSATGNGVDLGFLSNSSITDISLEIGNFAASYRAKLVPKKTSFGY